MLNFMHKPYEKNWCMTLFGYIFLIFVLRCERCFEKNINKLLLQIYFIYNYLLPVKKILVYNFSTVKTFLIEHNVMFHFTSQYCNRFKEGLQNLQKGLHCYLIYIIFIFIQFLFIFFY